MRLAQDVDTSFKRLQLNNINMTNVTSMITTSFTFSLYVTVVYDLVNYDFIERMKCTETILTESTLNVMKYNMNITFKKNLKNPHEIN